MLQFAQDGEFYYRSGSSKLEKNDLTGAIASYRMALKLDPKNYDAVLGIAEILTAMGRTEESNRLLMVKFREEERPAEAYFGMGCNFFAQREYDQARMSFDKYLDEDPEGEFAYTAYDMAEAIDDGTAQAYQEGPFAVPGYTEAEQARRLMEKEDFKGAIELLEKTVEEHPELPGFKLFVTAKLKGQTGVEMEALTGVSIGLLTIYDMAKAIDKYDRLILLLAGDGEQRDELIRLAAELGISDKVFFTGFVRGKQWRDAYSVSDVFVLSSVSEPFGLTALEAAHHDNALIITKQSGVGEVLQSIFRYDFWDVDRLADQLVGIATSPALKESLRKNITREYARISWHDVAKLCMSVYTTPLPERVYA